MNALPVILVHSTTALCDGGGGATGHPVEYIKLDKRDGASFTPCKYCGLRYKMAPGSRAFAGVFFSYRALLAWAAPPPLNPCPFPTHLSPRTNNTQTTTRKQCRGMASLGRWRLNFTTI